MQEAIKLLHPDAELGGLAGRGFFFDGISYDCFPVSYSRREACPGHEAIEHIIETALDSETATLTDVAREAHGALCDDDLVVDLPSEMVTPLNCGSCGTSREFGRLLGAVDMEEAACPACRGLETPVVTTQWDCWQWCWRS